ncbi:hypothetical protein PoB_006288200 [Plakobranchus ocellatus]|uniref:Uncharacterized protein n=1 Tax=Plakobranchus ocellatus TaxID=259542 RepID=A0AAV4CWT4_9GAST|nr:hypothetical protein PoB_006288200 [Plakobranchus ocellatus]
MDEAYNNPPNPESRPPRAEKKDAQRRAKLSLSPTLFTQDGGAGGCQQTSRLCLQTTANDLIGNPRSVVRCGRGCLSAQLVCRQHDSQTGH